MQSFSRDALALTAALLLALRPAEAAACTSFGTPAGGEPGHYLMAKNYDWAFGDGFVLAMPAGMRSEALVLPGVNDGAAASFSWRARHGSLALTQFGVGLTISGMNDAGLAVETLVNATGSIPDGAPPSGKPALVTLQWVQYQLDTAASVVDVVASLERVSVVQAFIPVHFLACDATGDCATIETDARGQHRVTRKATTARHMVLANRDWSRDAKDAKVWYSQLPGIGLERSSANRFARASAALADQGKRGMSVAEAFELLEDVGMVAINRWQIVWDLSTRTAHVRNVDGTESRASHATIALADLPKTCSTSTVAAPLGPDVPLAPALEPVARKDLTQPLARLFKMSIRRIEQRTDAEVGELSGIVERMQRRQTCS